MYIAFGSNPLATTFTTGNIRLKCKKRPSHRMAVRVRFIGPRGPSYLYRSRISVVPATTRRYAAQRSRIIINTNESNTEGGDRPEESCQRQ